MQLWKTSTERMPVKARHSHSGKHHGYDANCAGFSKDVKQPQSSETHRRREHSHRCRFARHLHTLLPTLGQSSGSRGHRLLDSLSGRATRACPPSAPPSAICATPARQNDGRCEFVPRLPHKTTVDVSLCRACHAKCRGVTGD